MQVTAHELGIPVEMVQVQPTNTITNANGSVTGGSMTSELVCYVRFKILKKTNHNETISQKLIDLILLCCLTRLL